MKSINIHITILLALCSLFVSCSPREIREAKHTVALADSLWHAGTPCDDSTSLAQAYETLGALPFPFREVLGVSSAYAHACYHYGRLLRQKENPVEAMQVFINATHSHTRDYHILGRIYSNMGSICHLSGEYALSYEMYECSANMFLQNGDSSAYYYALNDMAFELAEQGRKEETYKLLESILTNCNYRNIFIKTLETKAVACKVIQQYDSTIYYTSLSFKYGCYSQNILLNRAQAFSLMGLKDSAVNYANELILNTDELFYINSALYILTHEDTKKGIEEVRNISAERSDTQKLIEIRQGKLSQAVQLLEQDLQREPNLNWLYSILVTLVITGTSIGMYVYKKHKKRILLSQQVDELEIKNEERTKEMLKLIEEHCSMLRTSPNLKEELCWKDYDKMCTIIDKQFNMLSAKIRKRCVLNEKSFRLCILTLLDVDRKTISDMLPYALNSVGKLKDETAKSLGTTGKNLRAFLLKMTLDRS